MRYLLISNIHGCLEELDELFQKVNFRYQDDTIIFLGDMIDFGNNSYEVIHKIMELKTKMEKRCILLMGDHEKSFIENNNLLLLGRKATLNSIEKSPYDKQLSQNWLKEYCDLFYENQSFICTHASISESYVPLNDAFTLVYNGELTTFNSYKGKITITGHLGLDEVTYFDGNKGTTVLPEHIWKKLPETGIICIDTNCIGGNKLTCMIIKDEQYYLESVPKKK